MKAPPQALEGPGEEASWCILHRAPERNTMTSPLQALEGLERRLHGAYCITQNPQATPSWAGSGLGTTQQNEGWHSFHPIPWGYTHQLMSCDFLLSQSAMHIHLHMYVRHAAMLTTIHDHKVTCMITLHKINQIAKWKIPDPYYWLLVNYAWCLSQRSLISNKHKDLAQSERGLVVPLAYITN